MTSGDKMAEPPMIDDLFDARTLARMTDPVTSHEAAAEIADKITVIQNDVLEYAKTQPEGFTDRDLVAHFDGKYGPSTVRTRRAELVTKGKIGGITYRAYLPSRRRHTVWALR